MKEEQLWAEIGKQYVAIDQAQYKLNQLKQELSRLQQESQEAE